MFVRDKRMKARKTEFKNKIMATKKNLATPKKSKGFATEVDKVKVAKNEQNKENIKQNEQILMQNDVADNTLPMQNEKVNAHMHNAKESVTMQNANAQNEGEMTSKNQQNKGNWFKRVWNFFSLYEKLWLFILTAVGITLAILFPGEEARVWVRVVECITLVGGITCELLLSKQTKWAFVVSFFFYDLTQTIVYVVNGYYINALYEVIFWIPILFVSFFSWDKKKDKENSDLTVVKKINWKLDLMLFVVTVGVSMAIGALFTVISITAEGLSDYWWIDALGGAMNVLNGLFILMRFREQWIPWIGVCLCEAVMWCLSGRYVLLILSLGYLTNSIYGYIQWTRYIKSHPQNVAEKADKDVKTTESKV